MAKCTFNISINEPIEQLIEKARDGITGVGGSFDGNTQSGTYNIPTPVGKISGLYTVSGSTVTFTIQSKPVLVTCKKIEDEIKKHLQSSTLRAINFEISNVGTLLIKKPIGFKNIELMDPSTTHTSQLVTAVVSLYIEDEETFGSNETWRGTKKNSVTLSTKYLPQQFMEFVVKMGGEIRIELYLTAQIINNNGDVIIDGDFKLFEGTTEDNNDLDGQRTFQILVNNNSQSSYTSRVNNDDEGGDFAIATITIANSQLRAE
jgi:hypothetical protein